jgi:type IV pilus assembly protein PilE
MTLIELMIVVAVVALLGGIAIPSYQAYVMKARRADARAALTNTAQRLERFATENPTTGYSTAQVSDTVSNPVDPTVVYRQTSENGHYRLTLAAGVSTYTLTATPVAAGSQAHDPCGAYTLTQSGKRDVTGSLTMAQCW